MLKGLQFYDEQLRVLTFQKEHHHGYLNAFGAERGTRVTKEKATKGRRAKKTKKRGKETNEKAKVNETKPTRGTRTGKGSSVRAKSKAKKTDVCHHCGKKG